MFDAARSATSASSSHIDVVDDDVPEALPTAELAAALVGLARQAAAAACRWLGLLAEFDRREGWAADGQLSGADWLVWRCGLCPSTAGDKLRVAHELRRRPAVRAAFAAGELSYSKVRAITRIDDADTDTDRWLLKLAASGTAADLERVVRHWEQLRDQERGVDDYLRRFERRALQVSRTFDGMMLIEVVLPVEEGEELLTDLGAAIRPVDKASAEAQPSARATLPPRSAQRRVDALVDLVRAGRLGLDHADPRPGGGRYTLHVVTGLPALIDRLPGRAELLDGAPLGVDTLRRYACDCGIVRHVLDGASQPLDIGTRTSVWTTAQRRAISVRDGGRCRFPGCWRRTCDVHHVVHYGDGGPTAVDNGALRCSRHHTLTHEGGFTVTGRAGARLIFHRPDGTPVGSTQGAPNRGLRETLTVPSAELQG